MHRSITNWLWFHFIIFISFPVFVFIDASSFKSSAALFVFDYFHKTSTGTTDQSINQLFSLTLSISLHARFWRIVTYIRSVVGGSEADWVFWVLVVLVVFVALVSLIAFGSDFGRCLLLSQFFSYFNGKESLFFSYFSSIWLIIC